MKIWGCRITEDCCFQSMAEKQQCEMPTNIIFDFSFYEITWNYMSEKHQWEMPTKIIPDFSIA